MLLQGMEGGWVVIEASHTVRSGLNVTCHMLIVYTPVVHPYWHVEILNAFICTLQFIKIGQ